MSPKIALDTGVLENFFYRAKPVSPLPILSIGFTPATTPSPCNTNGNSEVLASFHSCNPGNDPLCAVAQLVIESASLGRVPINISNLT